MSRVKETRFYDLLGVAPDASIEEIRKNYKKLAFKYHPDRNPDAGNQFQEISMAYGVLTDEKKRKVYDQLGEDAIREGRTGDEPTSMSDLFGGIFGFGVMAVVVVPTKVKTSTTNTLSPWKTSTMEKSPNSLSKKRAFAKLAKDKVVLNLIPSKIVTIVMVEE